MSQQFGTSIRSFTNLQLTKRNVVDWGGEATLDQRLSGLASLRMQAPAGATSPPKGGRKDADFQSLNDQPTVFQQPIQGSILPMLWKSASFPFGSASLATV